VSAGEVHGDEVSAFSFTDLVNCDVGVVERGGGSCLADEALE
jgi:hypothetical protein